MPTLGGFTKGRGAEEMAQSLSCTVLLQRTRVRFLASHMPDASGLGGYLHSFTHPHIHIYKVKIIFKNLIKNEGERLDAYACDLY